MPGLRREAVDRCVRWLTTSLGEVYGLFVDDGLFAAAILAWLLVVALLPRFGVPPGWSGVCLFAGLAALLVGSARQQARKPPNS